jgi:hypothetical protein
MLTVPEGGSVDQEAIVVSDKKSKSKDRQTIKRKEEKAVDRILKLTTRSPRLVMSGLGRAIVMSPFTRTAMVLLPR